MTYSYVAVCPKCEMFIVLKNYYQNYFCPHVKYKESVIVKEQHSSSDMSPSDSCENIQCKVIRNE